MKIKNIIFDFDGTLIDSMEGMLAVYEPLFERLNLTFNKERARELIGNGITLEGTIKSLLPKNLEEMGEEITQIYRRDYADSCLNSPHLYPNVRETLSELKEFGMGIATSKRSSIAERILKFFEIISKH